jgi:ribosomal 30S subunit maturation factor RimM
MAQNWGKENSFHQIVGTSVKNQQGEELGKISDMVIGSEGHMYFAILSHGGFWGVGGKLVAVPFSALNFDQAKKNFVLNATKEMLDSAPAFKLSDLSNKKWVEDVYRFFGQRPYWTE